MTVYERGLGGWTPLGAPVRTSLQGTWARLREGVYLAGGAKPVRFRQ